MTETEALDKIIEIALKNKGRGLGLRSLKESGINFEYDEIRQFLKLIENSGLNVADLSTERDGEYIRANENTERFLKSGGFLTLEKQENEEYEYNRQLKEKELEKIESELQLNRWHIKTRFWPLIISGLSLIVSIIAIILSLRQPEKKELIPETKTIKDTTSVSSQTKMVDSLTKEDF